MKDKILAFLKSKITGGQESYLREVAEEFESEITDESKIETVLNAGVIKSLIRSQKFAQAESDRRVTEGIQTYEKKHGLKDGKPAEQKKEEKKEEEKKNDSDMPAWGKELLELNKKLVGEVTAMKDEKRKTELSTKLQQKLVTDLKIPEKDLKDFNLLSGVTVNEESEIETVSAAIKAKHETTIQALKDRGLNVVPPKEGNGVTGLLKDITAWETKKEDKK